MGYRSREESNSVSTHPNVILMAIFTPDDLPMKTHRAIMNECGLKDSDDQIKIGDKSLSHFVMEDSYNEDNQISAPESSIVVFDLVTYGYGESLTWDDLATQKQALEDWARGICERHKCSVIFKVGANYW